MKIVAFETMHADAGWDTYSFLKIVTDEGVIGWGEYNEARGRAGLSAIVSTMCSSLIGQDPRNVSAIEAQLTTWGMRRWSGQSWPVAIVELGRNMVVLNSIESGCMKSVIHLR